MTTYNALSTEEPLGYPAIIVRSTPYGDHVLVFALHRDHIDVHEYGVLGAESGVPGGGDFGRKS